MAAVALLVVVAVVWIVTRAAGDPEFSEHPQAEKVAFARHATGGPSPPSILIFYRRCGEGDLIPYVDATEGIGNDEREWEVVAEHWGPDETSWVAWRHPTGEEEPPPEPFEDTLPPPDEVRVNVHVYSASIENRWHVRVGELNVSELPTTAVGPFDVITADGETMSRTEWRHRANETC